MANVLDRRSLVLACDQQDRWALRALFESPLFNSWHVREADSIERARFVMQMEPCDVLVLDSALYRGDPTSMSWLAAEECAPVLLLSEPDTDVIVSALQRGARHWLSLDIALKKPEILAVSLHQLAQVGALQRREQAASEALLDCRRQVSRLVSLLWDSVPGDGRRSWFPQRHMLERLEEEVARSRRHGTELAVALGEIRTEEGLPVGGSQRLSAWTVSQVTEGKRRSDVAGQYGPNGFMLLLPNTSREGAVQCCRRIQGRLEQSSLTSRLPALHTNFGIESLTPEVSSVGALLSRAERQLERSKAGARALMC